jgi:hypothetical protein
MAQRRHMQVLLLLLAASFRWLSWYTATTFRVLLLLVHSSALLCTRLARPSYSVKSKSKSVGCRP